MVESTESKWQTSDSAAVFVLVIAVILLFWVILIIGGCCTPCCASASEQCGLDVQSSGSNGGAGEPLYPAYTIALVLIIVFLIFIGAYMMGGYKQVKESKTAQAAYVAATNPALRNEVIQSLASGTKA